jgi:hypothetical protein
MLCKRLHIREMFKRARASGSEEELRRTCFSVIPFMGHESDEFEVLGPLAPLPSKSRFTGKGAVFDMATETRVYRDLHLQPDAALAVVYVAFDADFDRLNRNAAFTRLTEAFINQMEIWKQESSVLINPNRFLPVAFMIKNMLHLSRMHLYRRCSAWMQFGRGARNLRKKFVHERQDKERLK